METIQIYDQMAREPEQVRIFYGVCVGCRIYQKPTWISFGLAFPYYSCAGQPYAHHHQRDHTTHHYKQNFSLIVARTLVVFPNIVLFNSIYE